MMTNLLSKESSPYLLQHAENPVAWYPWGEEALGRAREEDRPILLSIGYAACHWCHVMAHESFEDEETAALMNRHFVNIKVDREERPDLDTIYMSAVQAMSGHGGWPMTVFLTPDGRPIFGGTYYPPQPRYGMPSFRQVLQGVADAWANRREKIEETADQLRGHLGQPFDLRLQQEGELQAVLLEQAEKQLSMAFDQRYGGFGDAPKFPPSMVLAFLLQQGGDEALAMATGTLDNMAQGGIYDQIGGGFARYATDVKWLVPHFEKMLYDNAQLARVYLNAYQVTGNPFYRQVCEETLDWVVREMRDEAGGFYSSLDADSEGEEGRFYVWDREEIERILGEIAPLFCAVYGVQYGGNWEGKSILHLIRPIKAAEAPFLQAARAQLYAHRAKRVWPGRDEKIVTAWNGLMLAAFAEAGRVLQRPDYVTVATTNATFLWEQLRSADGRLWRTWKRGHQAKYNAYLEDYAYLAEGLLTLYQTTFEPRWFAWAEELAEKMITQFADEEGGGFYDLSADHEALLFRPKTLQDNATPSGNSVAVHLLWQLGLLTGENAYLQRAEKMVVALAPAIHQYPHGFGQWLSGAWRLIAPAHEIAIVGRLEQSETAALLREVWSAFRPNCVVAVGSAESGVPLLQNRPMLNGQPTAYVCQQFTCQQPVNTPQQLAQQLNAPPPLH